VRSWRVWVDEGALIAAGSDCNVSFFDPLLSIWGLVTRGTRTVGVQGPEYRVDTYTAIRLYTAASGRPVHDPDGMLRRGVEAGQ
jgi:predicted amidohydrolase YtcJ